MALTLGVALLAVILFATYYWGLPLLQTTSESEAAAPRIHTLDEFPLEPAFRPAAGGPPRKTAPFGRREGREEPPRLSEAQVAALLSSAAGPEDAALRLGRNVAGDALSFELRAVAEQLLWHLMDNESVKVREVIAETLQESPNLPHDMARRLIDDVDSVALPVLRSSPSVLQQDLVEVVRGGSSTKQVAIASRAEVPGAVVEALVDTENNRAVTTLVANPGAALDGKLLGRVADKFGGDPSVVEVLEHHPQLLSDVAALLKRFSVQSLIEYLAEHPELTDEAITRLVLRTLDESARGLVARGDGATRRELVAYLGKAGKLSPLLIRRALCGGEVELYEQAMATRAGISVDNAHALIHDGGELGPASLHDRAGIALAADPALRTGLGVLRHAVASGRYWSQTELQTEVLKQLIADRKNPCPDEIAFLKIRLNPGS